MPVSARFLALVTGLVACLSGCALDQEEELRQQLSGWLYLAQTKYFASETTCTVAVFDLARSEISAKLARARSIETALERVTAGQPVVFEMPGTSPNGISQQLMSKDLSQGLGMLSTGVGPVNDCMEEHIANGYYAVLMSPESRVIYDPAGDALIMVYPPENLAVFLRGNI